MVPIMRYERGQVITIPCHGGSDDTARRWEEDDSVWTVAHGCRRSISASRFRRGWIQGRFDNVLVQLCSPVTVQQQNHLAS